jgi:hypothetical protein
MKKMEEGEKHIHKELDRLFYDWTRKSNLFP